VPKAFHGLTSFKHKDFAYILHQRNAMLQEWGSVNTTLPPEGINAWIAKLDLCD
jgi:hypothetical protein